MRPSRLVGRVSQVYQNVGLSRRAYPLHLPFGFKTEFGRSGLRDLGYILVRQMPVMTLDHPCIGVAKVARQNDQRHPPHDGPACVSVAQTMEADGRFDLGSGLYDADGNRIKLWGEDDSDE